MIASPIPSEIVERRPRVLIAEQFLRTVPAIGIFYSLVLAPVLAYGGGSVVDATGTSDINSAVESGDASNRVFWILLSVLVVVAITRLRRFRPVFNLPIALSVGIATLTVASTAWSIHPDITIRRAGLQMCIIFCMLAPFICHQDPRTILLRIAPSFYVAMLLSLLFAPGQLGDPLGVKGIFGQKNMLGSMAGITVAVVVWDIFESKKWTFLKSIVLVIALLLTVISKSKTSEAMLLIAFIPVIIGLGLSKTQGAGRAVAICATLLLVQAIAGFLIIYRVGIGDISQFIYGDPTFTNRTAIWEFCERHIVERPLLGFGYGAFWGVGSDTASVAEKAGFIAGLLQSHNGFIDIRLQLGLVGLTMMWLIVVGSYLSALRVSVRHTRLGVFALYFLTFCYLGNSMESGLIRGYAPAWLMLLVTIGALAVTGKSRSSPAMVNLQNEDHSARGRFERMEQVQG